MTARPPRLSRPAGPRPGAREPRRRPGRRALVPIVSLVALLALTGCAGLEAEAGEAPEAGEVSADDADDGSASEETTTYPLSLDNCGVEVVVEAPPERIVTIKSSATETVLALGAGDRIVGHGFPDGPAPDEYADAAAGLPLLSDKVPSAEVVLGVEPDLVYAGWESNLTAESGGDRGTFADLGVATYVSPSACKAPEHQPDRLTFDGVFAEISEVGQVLGVPEAADELVRAQQAVLDGLEPDDRGLTALWYSSGTDVPYVGAGIGAPQMLMDAVGLRNIAAGVQDTWSSFSWEQVAEDDPDVIVLVDSAWNSAEQKKELLASSPATAELSAVKAGRYLVVPFAATEAGVRNVPAAADLLDQLTALEVG